MSDDNNATNEQDPPSELPVLKVERPESSSNEQDPPSELPVLKVERPASSSSTDKKDDDSITVTFAASDEKKAAAAGGGSRRRRSSRLSRTMTSYKFVNLSKTALVIIDIGEVYTKCGFAGESQPRHIFYNNFKYIDGTPMGNVFSRGHHIISKQEWNHAVWDYIGRLYFFLLQISPRERKVLICENPFLPFRFRRALVSTLLEQGAPGLVFVNNSHLVTVACQVTTGIVIDCGFGETRIMPVVDTFALPHIRQIIPLGMSDVHEYFIELWYHKMPNDEDKTMIKNLTFNIIDDIVARTMWVKPTNDKADQICADVVYSMGSAIKLNVPGIARQTCMDALFGENPERTNITHGVLTMLLKLMPETRAQVIENMMICGGTAMIPGFYKRFMYELNKALQEPQFQELKRYENKFRVLKLNFQANISSWVGGSLLGTLTLKDEHFVTAEKLKNDKDKKVHVTRVHPHTKIYSKLRVDDPMDYGVLDWTLQLPELDSSDEDNVSDDDYDDLDAANDQDVVTF